MKKYAKLLKSEYFIISMVTLLILLIIFLFKGIYPFGINTISNCDMNQSYITFYYYLYDVFHNGKSIFYNFQLGMGSNIYGGFVSDGFFNPTSWLILFSNRDNILFNMSFIIMIKFVVTSLFTMCFVQKVFHNVDKKIKFISVLCYTFSGYVFINYSNIMWIDIVSLFPLFCLGVYNIIEYNKSSLFILILSFCLINNYNLAYMILFFIFFAIPFLIKYKAVNKRKATTQIILGTILSVGISAFAFIPTFLQAIQSYRMSGIVTNTTQNISLFYKLVMGLFYSLPVIYLFLMIKDIQKDKSIKAIFGIILTTFLLPVIFERVNLLWHTGSYQNFGFRYGFIISFILMNVLLYGWQKYKFKKVEFKIKNIVFFEMNNVLFVFFSVLFITSMFFFISEFIHFRAQLYPFYMINQIILFIIIFFLSQFIYIYFFNKKSLNSIFAFTIILIICYGCSFFGHDDSLYSLEYSNQSILNGVKFNNELNIQNNFRIKDTTLSMTENYPLVVDVSSPSTFLHIISSSQVTNYYQMGYSGSNTKLNDTGGTVLSDTIYGIKYIISKEKINNEIYKLYKNIDDYYIYENLYSKFIYPVKKELKDEIVVDDYFEANNILAEEIIGKEKLLKKIDNNCIINSNKITCQYNLSNEELYFYSNQSIKEIKINGKTIKIPFISVDNNINYISPIHKILNFGNINSNVTIELITDNLKIDDINFATMNIQEYQSAFSHIEDVEYAYIKNKMKIHYNNKEHYSGLFVPINYDKGFIVTRNNKSIQYQRKLNNYIYLPLIDGENDFSLVYYPATFKESLLISIISVIFLISVFIFEKMRKNDKECKWVTYPFYVLGIIILIVMTVKIYLLPIIQTFI